jgi:O-antigen ligase
MMIWAISFPAFTLHGQANAVVSRFNGAGSADAATARRNQIKPLFTAVADHPILGSGFGKTVTYFSTDPTIQGYRTTTAFELGYLDLWLKLGLVGVIIYVWWIIGLWKKIAKTMWSIPFIIAGVALVVIHLTSPYLNHPLGLGWLMLTSLFAYDAS